MKKLIVLAVCLLLIGCASLKTEWATYPKPIPDALKDGVRYTTLQCNFKNLKLIEDRNIDLGLRSDGVVVWRKSKESK
jgi:hypothetical protein